jgi:oxygen-independent coproporphyrinogen-3 oxidase
MFGYKKAYFEALKNSLKEQIKTFKVDKIDTIFIGGGTPSAIEAKYYEDIFKILNPLLNKNCEITIEANPNSATKRWLREIFNLGINRISFGVQSFNNEKLRLLNRAHSAKEAIDAVENAAKVGFKNISIDIIYDFYLDSKELLLNDLNIAFSLPINHISTYELTIEKATPFSKQKQVKKNNEAFNFLIRDFIISKGFMQYEVSNYGTYKSKHNLGYWMHKNYLGVGAGAVGFFNNFRYYPHTNIAKFIQEPLFFKKELLSKEDLLTEKIFLGLRSEVGINKDILNSNMQKRADILVNEGKLKLVKNRYFNKEFFLSDELALFIMQN